VVLSAEGLAGPVQRILPIGHGTLRANMDEIVGRGKELAWVCRSFGEGMTPDVATRSKTQEDEFANDRVVRRRSRLRSARSAAASAPRLDGLTIDAQSSAALLRREARHRRMLGAADVIAALLAIMAVLVAFGQHHSTLTAVAGMSMVVFLFKTAGLYDRDELRLVHSTLDEVPALFQLTGLVALGVAILQTGLLTIRLSAGQLAALWLASFGAIFLGRVLARAIAGRTTPTERCLVIGELSRVERIRQKLAASRARATMVASLPIVGEDVETVDWSTLPVLLRRVVQSMNVHRIIIAPSTTDTGGVVNLIRTAKALGVRVSVLPRMFEVVGSAVEFDDVDGMTMLGVRRFGLPRSSKLLKRAFDVVLASITLLVLCPVFSAIALAIRLESGGSVFFRQVRVGRDGKHFEIFKFRSMFAGADARKDELRALNEAGDGLFKLTNDPRVTKVGRFLRRTSLDELPQLFNVLRGEMSLVGPRPLVIDEDAQVLGLDRSRLHLTPGMTGPWQVMGSRVPMQEMVGIDYLYVSNWSLWLDLKLLVRTARHVARRGNL
jgi:exopolysaccharide biosynthesis polyprenyl glycosylphosphotransferase